MNLKPASILDIEGFADAAAFFAGVWRTLEMAGCPFMDTYTAKALRGITTAPRILGARVCLVGLRPEVVRQMAGLGVGFGNVEAAMRLGVALMRLVNRKWS